MSKGRANSSPDLRHPSADLNRQDVPSPSANLNRQDVPSLEGVSTNVKLLLKLIQEHNEACNKDEDGRKMQRVAAMISIADDVKSRIEKAQLSSGKELRRCYTDVKHNVPKEKKPQESLSEENQKLRKELSVSLTARKSLEKMFSTLGKEKEIMSAELARKVHELEEMEEHLNDYKAQNELLLTKVKACAAEHKDKKSSGGDSHGNAALQERNKALSEQLLKSLDGYRSLKRKLKDAQEESSLMQGMMAEIAEEVTSGLKKIHEFRHQISNKDDQAMAIEKELSAVEHRFQSFEIKVASSRPKRSECVKPKTDVAAEKPSVVV